MLLRPTLAVGFVWPCPPHPPLKHLQVEIGCTRSSGAFREKRRSSLLFLATVRNRKALIVLGLILAYSIAGSALLLHAEDKAPPSRAKPGEEKRWQAVAPGRVEPLSGKINIVAPIPDLIGEVLIKAGDKVSAGEPLVRLRDPELYARLASAEAQMAMRKRARDDRTPSSWATDRRKAEDAVADAEQVVLNARAAFDQAVLEKRAGRASETDLDSARAALSRAEDDLKQQKADLRKLEADPTTPPARSGRRSAQCRTGRALGGASDNSKTYYPSANHWNCSSGHRQAGRDDIALGATALGVVR
jgi:hypothetical protein